MSIPLSPDYTPVENVLSQIKHLEADELVISTDWLKKKVTLKSAVTCVGVIHVKTQKTVIKPNGSSRSIYGTSDEVVKKR